MGREVQGQVGNEGGRTPTERKTRMRTIRTRTMRRRRKK